MKPYAVPFAAGCVLGFSVPLIANFVKNRISKSKQNDTSKLGQDEIDPRFSFPQPTFDYNGEYKLVIGVRMDVKHPTAELASLVGDMAIKSVVESLAVSKDSILQWLYYGQAMIVTKVPDLDAMNELIVKANDNNVTYSTIVNENGEPLIIGVGPAAVDTVNLVTRHLKLLN